MKRLLVAALYAIIAVALVVVGYCLAGAVGELNVKHVPYIITEDDDQDHPAELLPMAPIEITEQRA